jgi:pimeloyl-ACP methyl ester carboxylesterase
MLKLPVAGEDASYIRYVFYFTTRLMPLSIQRALSNVIRGLYTTPYGYSLSYEVQGEGVECVLFVMGFLCNRAYWGDVITRLHAQHPGRYTTCIYDQRGTSESTDTFSAKYSSRSLGRDILGLLLHLGWITRRRPIHLVGWSLGGFAILELLTTILHELGGHTLNITSLVLTNTAHKFTFPTAFGMFHSAMGVMKGILSCARGTRGESSVPHALKVQFSREFLIKNYDKLYNKYKNTRSPFDKPFYKYLRTLLGHARAVFTHYVASNRMNLLKVSGLTVHALMSTEDVLIHPTASINLANSLQCPFSYVKGGHLHHEESTDDFLNVLISVWGRSMKAKGVESGVTRYSHLASPMLSSLGNGHIDADVSAACSVKRWPAALGDEINVEEKLRLIMSKMDTTSFFNLDRLRSPGRIFWFPLLVLPLLLLSLRRIKRKQASVSNEAAGLAYMLGLLFLVQETVRVHG